MRARLLFVVPAAAALALLGACSSNDGSGDVSNNQRSAYLTALKAVNISFSSDDAAVDAGKKVCADLAAGKSISEAAEAVPEGKGMPAAAAAIGAFCSDQSAKVTEQMPSIQMPSIPSITLPG